MSPAFDGLEGKPLIWRGCQRVIKLAYATWRNLRKGKTGQQICFRKGKGLIWDPLLSRKANSYTAHRCFEGSAYCFWQFLLLFFLSC
jgi:hypothetical protein